MGKKEIITNIVVAAAGLGVGFGVGYYVSKRRMEAALVVLNDELDDVVRTFTEAKENLETQMGKPLTPQDAFERLHPEEIEDDDIHETVAMGRQAVDNLLRENGYSGLNEVNNITEEPEIDPDLVEMNSGVLIVENPGGENRLELPEREEPEDEYPVGTLDEANPITAETIVQSIWDNTARQVPETAIINEDADDMPEPTPDRPYIITVDQYMTDDTHEANKLTVMYYEEDGILVDEREQRVPDIEGTVGEANLHKFGLGSRDRNALYVRNERLAADFEIILDKRSYQEAVLGIKPRRESASPRKMRDDDE